MVTAKVLAVTLGPSQVGILSQLLNFSAFLFTILPLGLTTGVAKMVAESHDDPKRIGRVVGTSSLISLASAVACAVLLAPASGRLSTVLTGSDGYGALVLLVLASFPLYNLAGVLGYVIQGLADTSRLTSANVATAAAGVAVLVPATVYYGLTGAIAAVLVTSVSQSAVFGIATWRALSKRGLVLPHLRWDTPTARTLIGYGGIMLAGGIAIWGSLLVVRTMLLRQEGDYQNGIYQVVYGLSSQYMTIFMTWMGAYVFPRVVAEPQPGGIADILNSGLRANLFLMAPGLVLLVALREPLIHLLYARSFLPASPLIPIQALGDLARVIGWSFGVALFARGFKIGHLVALVGQSVAWVGLTAVLLPHVGVVAAAAAYSLSSIAWPLLMYPMVRRWLAAVVTAEGVALMVLAVASVSGAAVLPPLAAAPLALVVPGAILLMHPRFLSMLGRAR